MKNQLHFTPENIEALFGNEAAEDEDQTRLRAYYFKSSIYTQIVTDLPVRILVGHKGIGKSALFKVAIAEEEEDGRLSVLIRPNDIIGLKINTSDFLDTIRVWTEGLNKIIALKTLEIIGAEPKSVSVQLENYRIKIIDFIEAGFKELLITSKYNLSKQKFLEKFYIHVITANIYMLGEHRNDHGH